MRQSEFVLAGLLPGTGERVAVTVSGGVIAGIDCSLTELVASDLEWISPGLIDLQINGFGGHDVNAAVPTPDQIVALTHRLFAEGVTTYAPTVITGSHEVMGERISAIAVARNQDAMVADAVPYVHLEGPHLSTQDGPRGVHDPDQIRPPSVEEFDDWQSDCDGLIGMVTMSPHFPGSVDYINALVSRGIRVAIGHTHADSRQIADAATAGARLSTHLGNGAHQMLPRHPNYIWAQLANDRLSAGFIADGHHLSADTLTAMIRAKGMDRSFLVSDAVVLAGSPPGRYRTSVGGAVELTADGRLSYSGSGGLLAGATGSLADGVARAASAARIPLAGALRLATVNPGAFVGGRGSFTIGSRADLITFSWAPGDDALKIGKVFLGGRQVAGPT